MQTSSRKTRRADFTQETEVEVRGYGIILKYISQKQGTRVISIELAQDRIQWPTFLMME
jgi:hypothetical protein